ncbi:MAG: glycosyltransferase family 9 protein [Burkholderiales bacterium]|nr:glycosyltransferase family 9 protein [Burkholderiales bacterium]
MKILLWKIGALGDVVMTTPLVRQLRRNLPRAQIDYLVGRSFRGVLEGNPHLDHVLDFDDGILFTARAGGLPDILRLLHGYDAIYVLDKHWIFTWLARLSGAPQRVGFRRRAIEGWPNTASVPFGPLRQDVHYYLDLLEAAGLPVDRDDTQLELPPAQPYELPGPYIVAINAGGNNPGETSDVRQMPRPLFEGLVAHLARELQVVFLGSAQERSYYEPFAASYGAMNLCGVTTLPQSWGVLAKAEVVYTTDTGLMHMAGALNDRVLGIFGPTHPLRKCPPGARWVWRAEYMHDPRYELYGRVPNGRFFERMQLQDILDAAP